MRAGIRSSRLNDAGAPEADMQAAYRNRLNVEPHTPILFDKQRKLNP
jgi:hypothetical protein